MKIFSIRMKLTAVFIMGLFAANAWALPPQAEADKLMIEAKAAMEAKNYATAARDFARIEELHVRVPATFSYHYGVALLGAGNYELAMAQLDRYITQQGSGAKFYKEALEHYAKAEAMIKNLVVEMVAISGRSYEMGKYEVTEGQWRAVMGSNPMRLYSCGDDCPVGNVSWNDVQEYLRKLNAQTGKQYRLPSEAEWEYACRGGGQQEYCGSDNVDAVAWYDGNSSETQHPVGRKQANGYGLYDMSGNMWEWVQDKDKIDYEHDRRVLRGGSWGDDSQHARAADYGYSSGAARRSVAFGFRLARTLP